MIAPAANETRQAFEEQRGVYEHARFGRVITAMVTPFGRDGELLLDQAQLLAQWLEANGSEGLVVAGTTGESPALTHDEQVELIQAVHEAVDIPVLAGTGSNNTHEALELSGHVTEQEAADALLVVSPYYNRPPQYGIEDYYRRIADTTDLPVVIYDIPVRTGRKVATETILRLAQVENIVALKDAAGNVEETARLIDEVSGNFQVYSGDDALNLLLHDVGAVGAISVASHWAGREMAEMYDALEEGNVGPAISLNQKLLPSYEFETSEVTPNPLPAKAMLRFIAGHIDVGACRSPLTISDETRAELEAKAKEVYSQLHIE